MGAAGTLAAGAPARRAVATLLEAHGDRLYALGRRICTTDAEAEDLVQETLLAALRSWPRYKGDADPYTWLFRIAMRTCGRMHRKRAGEPAHLLPLDEILGLGDTSARRRAEVPSSVSSPADAAAAPALQAELRSRLDSALRRVPRDFRVALVLKDIADFSLHEIAAILEIRPATAKTRVHRGRIHLRRALQDDGVFEPLPEGPVPREICLDLLKAKLDALDRGVEFPLPHGEICDRCSALFRSLDLTAKACATLRGGTIPARFRARIRALVDGS